MAAVPAAQVAAVLDMNSLAAFEQLLGGLTSVDNTQRTQYEAIFNECKNQPDMLCLQLVRTLRTSQATETREMSSILLRRVLTKDEVSLWSNLQAQTQDGIKGELLKSLQEETTKSITHKVCDTVCELAAGIFEEGKWPELLPFLFQCVTAGSEPLKEASLKIFAQLAGGGRSRTGPTVSPPHLGCRVFFSLFFPHSSSNDPPAAFEATASFSYVVVSSFFSFTLPSQQQPRQYPASISPPLLARFPKKKEKKVTPAV